MNLQQLNEKYYGKTIDFLAWKHPLFGTPPNMGFSVESRFADGRFYNLRATLVLGAMETPHEVRLGKAVFDRLANVRVLDACENEVSDGGDLFTEDVESLIAPLFGLPSDESKVVTVRNNVCPWDLAAVIRKYAGVERGGIPIGEIERVLARDDFRREYDAAWEAVKRELVHYIACKFGLPEPEDLSEDYCGAPVRVVVNGNVCSSLARLRTRFERVICSLNPSWERSGAWVALRNEMLDQMFEKVGVELPPQAHELNYMMNGRKPKTWERIVIKA